MTKQHHLETGGQGTDIRVWFVSCGLLLLAVIFVFCPWYQMPSLQYSGYAMSYSLWNLHVMKDAILYCMENNRMDSVSLISEADLRNIGTMICGMKWMAAVTAGLLLTASFVTWRVKSRGTFIGKLAALTAILFALGNLYGLYRANALLDFYQGYQNSLENLTLHRRILFTSWPYFVFILSTGLFFMIPSFLDTKGEQLQKKRLSEKQLLQNQEERCEIPLKKGISKRLLCMSVSIFILVPLIIVFGILFLNDRSYYFIALCIILLAMVPFFMIFEHRRPQAREVVVIAVMASLAVAGRAAFFMIPQVKPITAIIMITGICLGPEAGFLTGALAGFASNFFFGQGPWTPWQMFAFGLMGFLAGITFYGRRKCGDVKWIVCLFGGVVTFLVYGGIMDTASLLMYTKTLSKEALMTMYISGIPFNLIHAISTAVFLFVLERPFSKKLNRVKVKYGFLR